MTELREGTRGAVSAPRRPIRVSVAGAGQAGRELEALARELGAALARLGAVVLCGGQGGVMEGVSRGAAEAGGIVVGFLPGADPAEANPWVGIPVATGLGEGRNVLVARGGEVLLAVGGSWGTLSEIALAQKLQIPVSVLGKPAFPELGLKVFSNPQVAAEWAVSTARDLRAD